jgi:hypothetical protein
LHIRGLAQGILELFRVYSPRIVGFITPKEAPPPSPYHTLIAIFRILNPAFLATVTVLGIDFRRTSPLREILYCCSPPFVARILRFYFEVPLVFCVLQNILQFW